MNNLILEKGMLVRYKNEIGFCSREHTSSNSMVVVWRGGSISLENTNNPTGIRFVSAIFIGHLNK